MNTSVPTPNAIAFEVGPLSDHPNQAHEKSGTFSAYAPPFSWGPWVQIATHGGAVNYHIEYSVLGDTTVRGAVSYISANGKVTEQFIDSVNIRTGNVWGTVHVCFYASATGSAIQGTISP